MSRKKEAKGSKIRKLPEIENKLSAWISENPNISNHKLSLKLRDADIMISSPTIKSWRDNFYKPLSSKIDETVSEVMKSFVEKKTNIKQIEGILENLEKRKNIIERQFDKKQINDKFFVDIELEKIYMDYCSDIFKIRTLLDKTKKDLNIYELVNLGIQDFFTIVMNHYPLSEDQETWKRLLNDISSLDKRLRDTYVF